MVQMLGDRFGNILANRKSTTDFMREAEEFEARKKQQKLQEQLMPLELEKAQLGLEKARKDSARPIMPFEGTGFDAQVGNIAYEKFLAEGLDPMSARQRAADAVLGSKMDYTMVTDLYTGKKTPVAKPRVGVFGAGDYQTPAINPDAPIPTYDDSFDPMVANQQAAAQQAQRVGGYNPYANVMPGDALPPPFPMDDILNMPAAEGQAIDFYSIMGVSNPDKAQKPIINEPEIDPRAMSAPDVQKKVAEARMVGDIDLARDLVKMDYENQIKTAAEILKSQEGKNTVANVVNRMNEINEALNQRGAIISQDQSLQGRAGTYLATTRLGQEARKVLDPESQALAEEYKKLQSILLPFFAQASGLGAKSLDSEGERKSILGSFGDPSGIYEANKNQIQNLYKVFGISGNSQTTSDIQNLIDKYAD